MRWATRIPFRSIAVVYFIVGQGYVWWQFLTLTPGRSRTLPEIVAPAVLEIVVALLIAAYVILRSRSLVWAVMATLNAIVLLVIDFSIWYASIGETANWYPRLTRLDGLALALGTLTTAGAPGITAHSELARGIITVQLVVDILAVIVLFGLFVGRLASRWRSPEAGSGVASPVVSAAASDQSR